MKNTLNRKTPRKVLQTVVTGIMACTPYMVSLAQNAEGEVQLDVAEPLLTPVPEQSTHAWREASPELLLAAAQNPDQFAGKQVMFENGREIGYVQDVRRSLEDLDLYFVVDATAFFNTGVIYAVPVDDVSGVQDDIVMVANTPGMHLPGMEYFPEDYTHASENFPEESPKD